MSDEVYEALRSGGFERPPEEVCTYAACYRAYTPVPELCYSGSAPQLPRPVEDRLSDVLNQFGSWSYQRLVRYVDRLLWMNPWKYYEYSGVDVYRYMLDQGFRIVHVEKCRRKTTRFPSLRGETFKYIYFHYINEHQNPNRLR